MSEIDAPGTCHQVGCEGKGVHEPHAQTNARIGAGESRDYDLPNRCLGTPILEAGALVIRVRCSIVGRSWERTEVQIDPRRMAELVELHKATCPNRLTAPMVVR